MPRATTKRPSGRRRAQTALDVLKADHAEVSKLFKQFERYHKAGDDQGMEQVAQAACKALAVHAQIEEEIFYPALRQAADADDDLDEANVEHSHIKELVGQLEFSKPGNGLFAARFTVLSEYVKHHVKEEEGTMFSKARRSSCDLAELGEQLLARKAELGGGEPVDIGALASRSSPTRVRNGQRAAR